MIFVALIVGAVLIVAAIRNSQDALFSALGQDVPGFVIWAAAIFAVSVLGFVPGLKPVSRGLLALVVLVLILHNTNAILAGFENAVSVGSKTSPGPPAASKGGTGGGTSGASNAVVMQLAESLVA